MLTAFFALSLTACGTNVAALLEEDSQLAWEAEETVQAAEIRNVTAISTYYEAETEKLHFCEPLYRKADAEIDRALRWGGSSIFDRFLGDLMLLGALLIPVPEVEDCVRAMQRYKSEYTALSNRIDR